MVEQKYHCALFDVDGTLVDSSTAHGLAWQKAFHDFGYDFSVEKMKQDVGMGGIEIVTRHLGKNRSAQIGKKIANRQFEYFMAEFMDTIQPFPYAKELLNTLAVRGVNIILASSALKEVVERFIDLLEVSDKIIGYVTADDVEHAKPAPDIFEKASQDCCPHKDWIVVVGDSPYDIEAAHRAGFSVVALVNGGFPKERLSGATVIFDTIEQLYKNIDSLFSTDKISCLRKELW